ncbi:DNA polymerase III subunit chi [Asticcacaulis sp. EMRT-3]|uniref:DNA polymerase III subunit chi n=1 Tax=Asticcacaulis sp. EMRT-3 TaxID=3040349 RepID=UPI0024AFF586|nr:DNA polymerase III subunit chi [Asticcacaulis sp. EMRT-3]MDI7774571.1 DNA polymerase III subunit chi [Asticcacaulis sp. EMRT-3]
MAVESSGAAGATGRPDVWFYHLEKSALEQALPDLLEKCTGKGWRVYVHGAEDADGHGIEALNSYLWSFTPASFLAHGREDDPHAELQPVLLGVSGVPTNQAEVYLSVAPVNLPDLQNMNGLQRCLIVFEGGRDAHLAWARDQWKRLKSEGMTLAYWKQNEQGRWERMQ